MSAGSVPPPAPPSGPGGFRRRVVNVSAEEMVRLEPLTPGSPLPLVARPKGEGAVDLFSWARDHRDLLERRLLEHGGLLFRGFGLRGAEDLERFIGAVSDEPLEYRERSSPRSAVHGRIYTSTDYPPEYPIFLHNENSYQSSWPRKIFFLCETAAERGGETPIADCRRVGERIPAEVRERFAREGWLYLRNFGDGFGLDWRTVFQTEDPAAVESHCRRHGIAFEWRDGGRLRTRALRPALARHPVTGESLWFNHLTFFHVSTLEPAVRESLLAELAEEDLPTNTYYGDGAPIEPAVLDLLREAYRRETVAFPWRQGDLLMLDNMLVAHGRSPFAGPRRVLVGMAEPVQRDLA